ncbi:cupin domain-containing protein [Aeromonas sp. BIGb0445]|uniref:cupin domain-containing protein n=1 Tax=Aeromonas sp. BIGb0445 TaxID=2940593 RepID=UPI002168482A|nr:cupin domain-containing protein [Aeromonas sp. BIGb0445]MCS3458932.1 mannose-6-phosphate isomerase-like protein (cupin superfamily) [Aeromonas sp. BIGb0445]
MTLTMAVNTLGKMTLADNIDIELLSNSDDMTVARILFAAPVAAAIHHHPHEEVNVIVAGRFEVQVGEAFYQATTGDCIRVAPHIPHSIRSLDGKGEVLTCWTPSRRDLVAKMVM